MSTILGGLGVIGIVTLIPLSIIGIALLVAGHFTDKQDFEKKIKLSKWGWRAILIPIGMILLNFLGSIAIGFAVHIK